MGGVEALVRRSWGDIRLGSQTIKFPSGIPAGTHIRHLTGSEAHEGQNQGESGGDRLEARGMNMTPAQGKM